MIMLKQFIDFTIVILKAMVSYFTSFDIGGFSYADFWVACTLISIFLGAAVIKFKKG